MTCVVNGNICLRLISHNVVSTLLQIVIDHFSPEDIYPFSITKLMADKNKMDFIGMVGTLLAVMQLWKKSRKRLKKLSEYQTFSAKFSDFVAFMNNVSFTVFDRQFRKKDVSQTFVRKHMEANIHCGFCRKKQDPDHLLKCSRCLFEYYCNRECQKKHWKQGHKSNCKTATRKREP